MTNGIDHIRNLLQYGRPYCFRISAVEASGHHVVEVPTLNVFEVARVLFGGEVTKAALQNLKQSALVTGDFLCHCLQRGRPLSDQARNQLHKFLFRSAIDWIMLLQR